MAYAAVQICPLTFRDWSNRASSICTRNTYHCVEDENSRIVEVCAVPLWIEAGHCPVYNTAAEKMDSRPCSGKLCPKEVFRSDVVYKYDDCQQFALSPSKTTSSSVNATTPLTNTSNISIIAGSVTSVIVVIILAILGFIFWIKKRPLVFQNCFGTEQTNLTEETLKKRDEKERLIESEIDFTTLEKITPNELDADTDIISQCQKYLETRGNTLAMYGKWGSGKRTLAAQVAIRLAKKDPQLRIKIVRDGYVISEDLESRHSTVMIIHDPVKAWFTSTHTDEIISCLLKICTNAKTNKSYILAIFHCNGWDSLKKQVDKKITALEHMFPYRKNICNDMQKLEEMVKRKRKDFPNVTTLKGWRSIGDPLIMILMLKNRAFQNSKFLSDPTEFIFGTLKNYEKSPNFHDRLAFRVMVYVVLHNGEIAKNESDDISRHVLFANLKEKIDKVGSIGDCIQHLCDLFIEETTDGQSFRILHDVITRCTFLAAVENHWTLLMRECNPTLIFDCIREKSNVQKVVNAGETVYKFSNIHVGIPTEMYSNLARLFYQRTEMISVLRNSRLFEDKTFKNEWNMAELHFTNETNLKNVTVK